MKVYIVKDIACDIMEKFNLNTVVYDNIYHIDRLTIRFFWEKGQQTELFYYFIIYLGFVKSLLRF